MARLPSFASDPVYALAVQEANRGFAQARRTGLERQSQLFLQLGQPEFAKAVYQANWLQRKNKHGKVIGQLTPYEQNQLAAVRSAGDPNAGTSTFAKIGRDYTLQQESLNNQLNAANLFYSGYRGKQLGELGRQRQFSESDALFGAQQGLNSVTDMLLQARRQRQQLLVSAAEQAWQRLLAQRLAGG